MVLSQWLKGRITIPEFDNLPFYYFHTLYKKYVDWTIIESSKSEEQRGSEAFGNMIMDNM